MSAMLKMRNKLQLNECHSLGGESPVKEPWIPACAGMTSRETGMMLREYGQCHQGNMRMTSREMEVLLRDSGNDGSLYFSLKNMLFECHSCTGRNSGANKSSHINLPSSGFSLQSISASRFFSIS
jgi:hypothetical protein